MEYPIEIAGLGTGQGWVHFFLTYWKNPSTLITGSGIQDTSFGKCWCSLTALNSSTMLRHTTKMMTSTSFMQNICLRRKALVAWCTDVYPQMMTWVKYLLFRVEVSGSLGIYIIEDSIVVWKFHEEVRILLLMQFWV